MLATRARVLQRFTRPLHYILFGYLYSVFINERIEPVSLYANRTLKAGGEGGIRTPVRVFIP